MNIYHTCIVYKNGSETLIWISESKKDIISQTLSEQNVPYKDPTTYLTVKGKDTSHDQRSLEIILCIEDIVEVLFSEYLNGA